MLNKAPRQSEIVSQRLEELMSASHLITVCGIDAESGSIVDVIPVLENALNYAMCYKWTPINQWCMWRDQLSQVSKYVAEHSNLIRPLGVANDLNPLRGEFEKYPLITLLIQPNLTETTALSNFFVSAIIYRLARNLDINIERHICDRLRKSIAKKEGSDLLKVLQRSIQNEGLKPPYSHWGMAKHIQKLIQISKNKEDLSFLRWMLTLVNIETDSYVRPVVHDVSFSNIDQDDNSPTDEHAAKLISVTSKEHVESSNTLIVESEIGCQIKVGSDNYDLELEDNACVPRSSYWLDTIEKSVPYGWSVLNPIERGYLVKELCSSSKEAGERTTKLLLLLSIVTSLNIEDICALPIGKGKSLEMPGIYRRRVVRPASAYVPPEESSEYLYSVAEEFVIKLPKTVQAMLKLSFINDGLTVGDRLGGNVEELRNNCNKYLYLLKKRSGYRYVNTRIKSMLRHALNRKGTNKLAIYFLTSAPLDSPPIEAYYIAITENQLQEYFDDAVNELLGN